MSSQELLAANRAHTIAEEFVLEGRAIQRLAISSDHHGTLSVLLVVVGMV